MAGVAVNRSRPPGASFPTASCRKGLLLLLVLFPIASIGIEVPIRLTPLWPEPANIAVHLGDTVTWRVDPGRAARVRGLEGKFQSPVLSDDSPGFSFVCREPGLFAYENEWLNTAPPHDPAQSWTRSRGTVQVLGGPQGLTPVTLNAPVAGARFALQSDAGGRVTSPAAILFQASVSRTSGVQRVEFQANGRTVAVATKAPFRGIWVADQPGAVLLWASAIDAAGIRSASQPVWIRLDPMATACLFPPREVRPGLFLVDYLVPGGGRWVLQVGSRIAVGASPDDGFEVYIRGQGGQFPMTASVPRRFFWLEERH